VSYTISPEALMELDTDKLRTALPDITDAELSDIKSAQGQQAVIDKLVAAGHMYQIPPNPFGGSGGYAFKQGGIEAAIVGGFTVGQLKTAGVSDEAVTAVQNASLVQYGQTLKEQSKLSTASPLKPLDKDPSLIERAALSAVTFLTNAPWWPVQKKVLRGLTGTGEVSAAEQGVVNKGVPTAVTVLPSGEVRSGLRGPDYMPVGASYGVQYKDGSVETFGTMQEAQNRVSNVRSQISSIKSKRVPWWGEMPVWDR
jgi:hypothetical protein